MSPLPVILFLASAALLYAFLFRRKEKNTDAALPDAYRAILQSDIPFYRNLQPEKQVDFEKRLMRFLSKTRIVGVKTGITDADKVYIAASAIMPIFGFGDWEYNNLDEVLVYPSSFDHDFSQSGEGRNILGIVGEGALQRVMVLSQQELRRAFQNHSGKENTAIHEFVHLIDKSDGSTDGIPEFFLGREYVQPWLQLIHREIGNIRNNRSDINPYGMTSEAEFFAVASEYFFEKPELLQQKHPELYSLLVQAFHQQPSTHL
jgi:Mlc titration factor MtfA (ptsG expression regulator)